MAFKEASTDDTDFTSQTTNGNIVKNSTITYLTKKYSTEFHSPLTELFLDLIVHTFSQGSLASVFVAALSSNLSHP